jgi:ATP-dependent Clp protease ATP-binding subunit ClpC
MKNLSIGAYISWQIAAHEAAAARFQFIEKEHLFIGICSLEKILKLSYEDSGLNQKERKALQDEYETLQAFLKDL